MQTENKLNSRRILLSAIIFLVAALAVFVCLQVTIVDSFSLDEYSDYCVDAVDRESAAAISGRFDAAARAKELWQELYQPNEALFCKVSYDPQSNCWLVTGMSADTWYGQWSMIYGVCGGVYHAIFSSDGQILAVWVDM